MLEVDEDALNLADLSRERLEHRECGFAVVAFYLVGPHLRGGIAGGEVAVDHPGVEVEGGRVLLDVVAEEELSRVRPLQLAGQQRAQLEAHLLAEAAGAALKDAADPVL